MSDIVGVPNMKHKNVEKTASMSRGTGDLAAALGMSELRTTEHEMKVKKEERFDDDDEGDRKPYQRRRRPREPKADIKPAVDESDDEERPDIDLFRAVFASDDEGLEDASS